MSVKLSAAALAGLPSGVAAPKYRRSDLSAGIVHIGVGNFHRAHQAVYLDDLFNAGRDRDWAIVGAGVRDADVTIREKLKEQDWLTTVVEQEADTTRAHVTGAMIDFVKPYDTAALLDTLSEPRYPHRLADRHRGRILHLAGDAAFRSRPSRHRLRRAACGRAEDGLRTHRRRAQAPPRRRRCAVHGDVLRQHPGQWPRH